MDGALGTPAGHIALAVAAGTTAKEAGSAIKQRYDALKAAIAKKSDTVRFDDVEGDPASVEHRSALAKDLEMHGAAKDKEVLTVARELLGLIKVDDAAREDVGTMIDDVEAALTALSEVEHVSDSKQPVAEPSRRSSTRVFPEPEPSKTELERSLLPVWERTERFFLKLAVFVGAIFVIAIALWLFLRTPPSEALERCRAGDKGKCWQVVAAEDTIEQGKNVAPEPLSRLCGEHNDACGCAGLAYVNATHTEGFADCAELTTASSIDPQWPCKCTRYAFWRAGELRTAHCGIPRCDAQPDTP
jgi:hypothetical protein